jgi:hypothetical protein
MADTKGNQTVPVLHSAWTYSNTNQVVQKHLGGTLRTMSDQLPVQPITDQLSDLLHELDAAGASQQPPADAD